MLRESNEIEDHGFDELYIHWLVASWYMVNDLIEIKGHYFFFFQKWEWKEAMFWLYGVEWWFNGKEFISNEYWFNGISEYVSRWECIIEFKDESNTLSKKIDSKGSLIPLDTIDVTPSEIVSIILWNQQLN